MGTMELVINKCHGGFGLSHEAVKRYFELNGWNFNWRRDGRSLIVYSRDVLTGTNDDYESVGYISPRDIPRDDQNLIRIIKEMGSGANGDCAELRIAEIPDGVDWEIEEYDGMEWVSEKHRTWG